MLDVGLGDHQRDDLGKVAGMAHLLARIVLKGILKASYTRVNKFKERLQDVHYSF